MKLRFVLRRGFLVTRLNGIDFYQVFCYSVETTSMSSFVESQHTGLTARSPIDRKEILIPLSRLHMNRISSLLFEQSHCWTLVARSLCIKQCREISEPLIHHSLLDSDQFRNSSINLIRKG